MELSLFTDYSLRTLIYAGLHRERRFTVPEVATAYRISEHHLVKVAHKLGTLGYLETKRGRNGGFRLDREPEAIPLGDIVRATESMILVDCFREDGGTCPIRKACVLKGVVAEAQEAFLQTFDRYTLHDLLQPAPAMLESLVPAPR